MNAPLTQFDAIHWINCYFENEVQLNQVQLEPVLCFSLMWNIFETVACRKHACPTSIRTSVDHADEARRLRRGRYMQILRYFQDRYGTSEQDLDSCFDRLLMTDRRSQEAVRRVLQGASKDLNNIVYGLLLIAHRIRNNLFHGNKRVPDLPKQTELFVVVNSLLATYLEDIGDMMDMSDSHLYFEGRQGLNLLRRKKQGEH